MAHKDPLNAIQRQIWDARIPLEIRLAPSESRVFDKADPYLISCPRLTYLPVLLPQLLQVFSEHLIAEPESLSADTAYFTFESVPLKWHLPVGLLYDLYVLSTQDDNADSATQTQSHKAHRFCLTVHFSPPPSENNLNLINMSAAVVHDSFINSVKEADFLRSGTAKPIMSLSAADSKALWSSTQDNDLPSYSRIFNSLLPATGQMRNIPLRIFLPSSSPNETDNNERTGKEEGVSSTSQKQRQQTQGQIKVLQAQIPPLFMPAAPTSTSQLRTPSASQMQQQTLGTALHSLLPSLFPSKRTPILARPLLHGAALPMSAVLEELARKACYADGWINVVVSMNT